MKNTKKSQETNWNFLLAVIVLAISIGVILFLLSQLNLGSQINEETCYSSVTLKKTIGIEKPLVGGKWVDIPLRCKTENICLMVKGDKTNCDILLGKEYTKTIVSSETAIYKVVADSMAACWSMMGESKGGMVFSREFSLFANPSNGVICSIIGFSDDAKLKYPELSTQKFYNYMNTEKVPEKTYTYAQYLANIANPTVIPLRVASEDVLNDKKLSTNQPYSVVFVEYERNLLSKQGSAVGGAILAGAIYGSVIPGAGTIAGAAVGAVGSVTVVAAGIIVSLAGGAIASEADDTWNDFVSNNKERYCSSIYLKPYTAEDLTALHIQRFQSIS
ncbi:MAG: hypothetical protein AABX17_02110 [Nanoarchaeota archaeon]